jgi:hypothetical protein
VASDGDTDNRYAVGYWKNDENFRVMSPYMGETHESLEDAEFYIRDEELNEYLDLVVVELVPVKEIPRAKR